MQLHLGRFKVGIGILGALVPAVVLALVALMALAPGQVRAESEPKPEAEEPTRAVCEGLSSLTMSVNTKTLQNLGKMTKSSFSSDGECEISVTLIDVSSDTAAADKTKSCSVTVAPIRPDNSFDVAITESGECSTVAIDVDIDYGDSLSSNGAWARYTPSKDDSSTAAESDEGGVSGRFGCDFDPKSDDPHMSSSNVHVSVHGWWIDNEGGVGDCPYRAWVTVWLKAYYCESQPWGPCTWRTVGSNRYAVRAKNLSGNEVNARSYCGPSTTLTGYRGTVDVDLIGQFDWPDRHNSTWQNFFCNPH